MSEQITLSTDADDYFRTLPGLIYPQALVSQYPRIANHMVELRFSVDNLREYFRGLLEDTRGERRGFPEDVLEDIRHLYSTMVGGSLDFD
jgi:hypothetical protein